MKITTQSKTTIETTAVFNGEILKSHDCNIGDWGGRGEICQEVDFNKAIIEHGIPYGEYKIVITLEKI